MAWFRRKQEDPEVARRTLLLRTGRLGEATVLGVDPGPDGKLLLSYCYTIGGVDYETMQHLDEQQVSRKDNYLPGSRVPLRYDPHRPANSLVV